MLFDFYFIRYAMFVLLSVYVITCIICKIIKKKKEEHVYIPSVLFSWKELEIVVEVFKMLLGC